jgi:hypothetical protein
MEVFFVFWCLLASVRMLGHGGYKNNMLSHKRHLPLSSSAQYSATPTLVGTSEAICLYATSQQLNLMAVARGSITRRH